MKIPGMPRVRRLEEHCVVDDQSRLLQRQLSEHFEHLALTLRHLRALVAADINTASAVELSQVEVQTAHAFEAPQHRLVDAVSPRVHAASVVDADAEAQAADREVLFVLEADSGEALEDVVAVDGEGVVRVRDHTGLQVDLTAGAKQGQAELVGFAAILLLRWRSMAELVSIFGRGDVPGYNIRVRGVKLLLDLLFGERLDAGGVGELHRVIAMDVHVVLIVLEYVHHLAPANEVIDAVFDLLW